MTRLRATLAACLVIAGTGLAMAQEYPARPVRLIIPFPPGGSNDVVGRADRARSSASGSASRSWSTTAAAPAA